MASSSSSEPNNQEGKPSNIPVDENVMQKHVGFFDRNHDGVVYPWETFQGLRAIGCGRLLSTASIIIMHLSFSQITRPGKKPSPFFPIEVKNIQLAKHGSDSGVYDNEGRFIPSKFEEIFSKHAHAFPNALTYDEIQQMLKAKRDPKDYKGWVFSEGAWTLLFILGKDKNGLLQKETVRGVYDGSLFEQLEKKHSENKKK